MHWCLQVIARAGNQLQTYATSRRRRMGPEKALCALALQPNIRQLGRDLAMAHLRKGTKLDSGSCINESETLLGKPSSAPNACLLRKAALYDFSPNPLLCIGTRRAGLPPAPCELVLCRSLLELETNSKRTQLHGEGGWGQKRPCVHWPQNPTFRQLGWNHLGQISEKARN